MDFSRRHIRRKHWLEISAPMRAALPSISKNPRLKFMKRICPPDRANLQPFFSDL
jgi:hypothetical protein